MTLAEHFYSINYFKPERLVELTWLPGTQEMTDQDFKEALCVCTENLNPDVMVMQSAKDRV
jgi:hypothetical protein